MLHPHLHGNLALGAGARALVGRSEQNLNECNRLISSPDNPKRKDLQFVQTPLARVKMSTVDVLIASSCA